MFILLFGIPSSIYCKGEEWATVVLLVQRVFYFFEDFASLQDYK